MFWIVGCEPWEYPTKEKAVEAAQRIADREDCPIIVAKGIPGVEYAEVDSVVRPAGAK